MKRGFSIAALAVCSAASGLHAQATATANVTIGAEGGLAVSGTSRLASTGSNFGSYTSGTSLTYYIRTSPGSGSGSIQLQVTTDFTPAGGPSVAIPPTNGDKLSYTCTAVTPGNGGTA